MDIKAFTNEFGQFDKNHYQKMSETNKRTGVITDTSKNVREQRVTRQYHSSNPPITDEYGYTWRNPSNYRRVIHEWKYTNGRSETSGTVFNSIGQADIDQSSIWSYPLSATSLSIDAADRLRARTEAIKRLNEGAVHLGNFLVETKKTAEMLATTVIYTADMLRNIRRGRFPTGIFRRSIVKDSRLSANIYLQYQYGWKPLLTDIYHAVEMVKAGMNPPQVVSAVRSIKSKYNDTSDRGSWRNRRLEAQTRATCKLYAKLDAEFIYRAQSSGVINPLSVGWEVIPYSFVVDWLIPVGNFLEALTANAGLTFMGGYESSRISGMVSGERQQGSYNPRPRLVAKASEFQRFKLNSFPIPVPYMKSPFSTTHVLSAAALVRSLKW